MIVPKGTGVKRKPTMTPRDYLVDNIARDTALLHKHEKQNAQALADRSHNDFYFANSTAGVIARRISANLKRTIPLKTRGNDTVSNLIDHYNTLASAYERNAKKTKPEGYASMGYQRMAEVVGENRKLFDKKVLRNRALGKAEDLIQRLPKGKANPSQMAKMHNGIYESLLDAARYTHFLRDGGTGQIPTVDNLMNLAKHHENESKTFTSKILKAKQEQQKLKQARRKA